MSALMSKAASYASNAASLPAATRNRVLAACKTLAFVPIVVQKRASDCKQSRAGDSWPQSTDPCDGLSLAAFMWAP